MRGPLGLELAGSRLLARGPRAALFPRELSAHVVQGELEDRNRCFVRALVEAVCREHDLARVRDVFDRGSMSPGVEIDDLPRDELFAVAVHPMGYCVQGPLGILETLRKDQE